MARTLDDGWRLEALSARREASAFGVEGSRCQAACVLGSRGELGFPNTATPNGATRATLNPPMREHEVSPGHTRQRRPRRAARVSAALGAAAFGASAALGLAACGEDREGGSLEQIGPETGTTGTGTGATVPLEATTGETTETTTGETTTGETTTSEATTTGGSTETDSE